MCCSSHGDSDRKLLLIEHRREKTSQISTLSDFQTNDRYKSRGKWHNHTNREARRGEPRTYESESTLIPANWGRR